MDVEFYLLKTEKKLNKKRKRKTFVFHLCPSKHLNVGRWISKYPLTRLKAFLVKIEKQTKSISLRRHFDVWQIVNWRYSVAIGLQDPIVPSSMHWENLRLNSGYDYHLCYLTRWLFSGSLPFKVNTQWFPKGG